MSESGKISLLVVDDHPLLREGVSKVINDQPDMCVVAQAARGAEAIALYREHAPDITLLDLRLPDIARHRSAGGNTGGEPESERHYLHHCRGRRGHSALPARWGARLCP